MNVPDVVRARVKQLLAERGKGQQALATALGYKGKSSVTEILQGRQNLPPSRYEAAATFFDITLQELLDASLLPEALRPNPQSAKSYPVAQTSLNRRDREGQAMVLNQREALIINTLRVTKDVRRVHEAVDLAFRKRPGGVETRARSRLPRTSSQK